MIFGVDKEVDNGSDTYRDQCITGFLTRQTRNRVKSLRLLDLIRSALRCPVFQILVIGRDSLFEFVYVHCLSVTILVRTYGIMDSLM